MLLAIHAAKESTYYAAYLRNWKIFQKNCNFFWLRKKASLHPISFAAKKKQ